MSLSVLIVEDHPMVAHAMANELRSRSGLDSVLATNAASALRMALDGGTDWFRLFLDLDIPGARGLSLARRIASAGLAGRCCIVSATDRPEIVAAANDLGLLGYIIKACPYADFCKAIDRVLAGQRTFPDRTTATSVIRLSLRQEQLLNYVRCGLTSREIALRVCLSEGTVNNCITGLLSAMGATSRGHAVALALELGLLPALTTTESNPASVGAAPPAAEA